MHLEHTRFNSRPCERGDRTVRINCDTFNQFQFTPLREGRLSYKTYKPYTLNVSIHAPARGATSDFVQEFFIHPVSIHAPARGATGSRSKSRRALSFQFTPLREGRLILVVFVERYTMFQFTPLREGRPMAGAVLLTADSFNSRPCERGDRIPARDRRYFSCFNSRPCERGDF